MFFETVNPHFNTVLTRWFWRHSSMNHLLFQIWLNIRYNFYVLASFYIVQLLISQKVFRINLNSVNIGNIFKEV